MVTNYIVVYFTQEIILHRTSLKIILVMQKSCTKVYEYLL